MDRSNVSGSHSKRQAGIPSLVEAAPQLGHPSAPGVVDVLDNKPIRSNPSELRWPVRPACRPAIDKSWQGNPAVTIKPFLDNRDTERVDLAELVSDPSDPLSCDREAADSRKEVKVFHSILLERP
jgi:hypothetical protein